MTKFIYHTKQGDFEVETDSIDEADSQAIEHYGYTDYENLLEHIINLEMIEEV